MAGVPDLLAHRGLLLCLELFLAIVTPGASHRLDIPGNRVSYRFVSLNINSGFLVLLFNNFVTSLIL